MSSNRTQDKELIESAKRLALEEVNLNRARESLPPLKRLERIWWLSYGDSYLERIKRVQREAVAMQAESLNPKKRNKGKVSDEDYLRFLDGRDSKPDEKSNRDTL